MKLDPPYPDDLVQDLVDECLGEVPPGKPPKWIWVASPYGDDPEARTDGIRDWCRDVFATLNPNTILPIPVVGRSGDWGNKLWSDDEWYRVLKWDLYSREWSGVICVERLLGKADMGHERSKGMAMERKIAADRGLPILTVDAHERLTAQRLKISEWLSAHWAPPWNDGGGVPLVDAGCWFRGLE